MKRELLSFSLYVWYDVISINSEGAMWKYECKRHLLYLLIAAGVGALLFGITVDKDVIKELGTLYDWITLTQLNMVYEWRWALGAMIGASLINGVLLLRYFFMKFNVSPMLLLLFLLLFRVYEILLMIGLGLLLPSILICIYGMLTARNSAAKNFRSLPNGNGNEVERIYRLHHAFDENVRELALKCRRESDRWSIIYVLGLIALMCVTLIIPNMMLMMMIFLGYGLLFVYVFRLRTQSVMPINSLLFENCDPIACASAILIYSKRGNRLNLKMNLLFAQCMLCLDDPQLAMDALVLMSRSRNNNAMELNYQTLMAEANYQLGDQAALELNLQAVRSIRVNIGAAGNLMLQETIASIQNKLYLMNEHFDQCEAYYRQMLPQMKLRLQQVDAHYYLGLIAFVRKDLLSAKDHFTFVVDYGNTTSYLDKAKKYMTLIDRFEPKEEQ